MGQTLEGGKAHYTKQFLNKEKAYNRRYSQIENPF